MHGNLANFSRLQFEEMSFGNFCPAPLIKDHSTNVMYTTVLKNKHLKHKLNVRFVHEKHVFIFVIF